MSTTSSSETTLNIPSLLAFAVVSFLAIRYFFFSGAPASSFSSSAPPPGARNGRPIPPDKIEQVAMMFPQLARRDIEWDLVRNGGSVQATTEKVLRTGRLDTPPPNFRAQEPPQSAAASSSLAAGAGAGARASAQRGRGAAAQKIQHPDLITRYNLAAHVAATQEGEGAVTPVKGGWSQNKSERQDLLKHRREEMVLAARRKMEARDREAAAAAGSQ